jgi:hypothetical protein
MLFIHFSLRHMLRHWRLNLALLAGLTLGAALLAGLPTYARGIAAHGLEQDLEGAAPAARNILVEAPNSALTAALDAYVKENLPGLVSERLVVQNTEVTTYPDAIVPIDSSSRLALQRLSLWAFDKMTQNLHLLTGEWPGIPQPSSNPNSSELPVFEAVISRQAAERAGVMLGDRVVDDSGSVFEIMGIVEPFAPQADLWWGDVSPFEVVLLQDPIKPDEFILPLIIHQGTMRTYFTQYRAAWRFILDRSQINVENVEAIEKGLVNLKSRLEVTGATLKSGLPNLLLAFRNNQATARIVLFLLSVQAFLFVLYTLTLLVSLLIERSQSELAAMVGRGAHSLQITASFALQGLLLALLAGGLFGPLLARLALEVWSRAGGQTSLTQLPAEAWQLSLAAAAFGWVSLALTIYFSARRNLLEWQRHVSRPARMAAWQRGYLDFFLLVLGALAYWQLSNSGSFVLRRLREIDLADPLLLLGPSLLLIAAALITLRAFPYLLSLVARLARAGDGFVLPVGLARLARDPVRPSRVLLLISLAAGLALFARVFSDSLAQAQDEIARYQAGSDLRVRVRGYSFDEVKASPGILEASSILRGQAQGEGGRGVTILAVDPDSFKRVAAYPKGMTNLTMEVVMEAIRWSEIEAQSVSEQEGDFVSNPFLEGREPDVLIPAIFSYGVVGQGTSGDRIQLTLGGNLLAFQVRGILADFPTLSGLFLVVDKAAFEEIAPNLLQSTFRQQEAWLRVDPDQFQEVRADPAISGSILADASRQLDELRGSALTQGATRAFALNAFILALLSLAGFILVSFFTAQQRLYEFSVLRALGLSPGQVTSLLAGESLLVIALGLTAGFGLGYGLVQVMRPYLSLAVAEALPGLTVWETFLDWPRMLQLMGALTFFYGLAVVLLLVALSRSGVQNVLRLGEE